MNEKIKKNLKTIRNIYLYFKITSTIIKHAGLLAQNTEHKIELIDIKELNSLNQYTPIIDFLELNINEPVYININIVYVIPEDKDKNIPTIEIPIIYTNPDNETKLYLPEETKLYTPEINISITQKPEKLFLISKHKPTEIPEPTETSETISTPNFIKPPQPIYEGGIPYISFYIKPINSPVIVSTRPTYIQRSKVELIFDFEVNLNKIKEYINSKFFESKYIDYINSIIDEHIKTNKTPETPMELLSYKLIVIIIGNKTINFINSINTYIERNIITIETLLNNEGIENTNNYTIKAKYSASLFILNYLNLLPEFAPSLTQYINLLSDEDEKALFFKTYKINENNIDSKELNKPIDFDSPYHIYKIRDMYLNEYVIPKRTRHVKKRKLTLSSSFYRVMYALRSLGLIQIIDEKSEEYKNINDFFKSKTFENTIDKVFVKLTDKGKNPNYFKYWTNPIKRQREENREKSTIISPALNLPPTLNPTPALNPPLIKKKSKNPKNTKNTKKKQTNKPKQL